MALTTQTVLASLMEKFGNNDGGIVGLTQDELVRAFQQVNTTSKPSRKARKAKDPNAPKRPTSAYMIWLNENRTKIVEEHCAHLTGREKVKGTTREAGRLWKEMDEDTRAPYQKKFEAAQLRYASEKEGYVPTVAKIEYDVSDFPEAPDGWSGPYEMKYLSKIVKEHNSELDKMVNIPTFKKFSDAVERANALGKEECGGITKTARGYQLRVGGDLITNPPDHARTGLASWVKGSPEIPSVGISESMDAPSLVKNKKVSFQMTSKDEASAPAPAGSDEVSLPKRGRGRPKGSKNKSDTSSPEPAETPASDEESLPKRGRGRPKGSKNKAKTPSPEPEESGLEVETIDLDIGQGTKNYYINPETREVYDPETTEKIGELNEKGEFVSM